MTFTDEELKKRREELLKLSGSKSGSNSLLDASFEQRRKQILSQESGPLNKPEQPQTQTQPQPQQQSFISKATDYISSFFTKPSTTTPTNVGGDLMKQLDTNISSIKTDNKPLDLSKINIDRSTPIYDMSNGNKFKSASATLTPYGEKATKDIADAQNYAVNAVGKGTGFVVNDIKTDVTDISSTLIAGTGDLISGAGSVAHWMGADGLADALISKGGEYQDYGIELEEFKELDWKDLLNPRFYTTQLLRGAPFTLATMPLAIVGGYAGASAAGAIGLGKLGTVILTTIGGSGLATASEAVYEGGSTYDQVLDETGDANKANKAAQKSAVLNGLVLGVTNTLQFLPFLKNIGRAGEVIESGTKNKSIAKKIIKDGAKLAGEVVSEGGEEVIQKNISLYSQEKSLDFTSKETQKEFVLGAMQGLVFTAGGTIIEKSTNRDVTKQVVEIGIEQAKQTIKEIKQNIIEQVPEVKADVEQKISEGMDPETATIQAIDTAIEKTPRVIQKVITDTVKQKVAEEEQNQKQSQSATNKQKISEFVGNTINDSASPEITQQRLEKITDTALSSAKDEKSIPKIKALRAELNKQMTTLVGGKSGVNFKADYAIIQKAKSDPVIGSLVTSIENQIAKIDKALGLQKPKTQVKEVATTTNTVKEVTQTPKVPQINIEQQVKNEVLSSARNYVARNKTAEEFSKDVNTLGGSLSGDLFGSGMFEFKNGKATVKLDDGRTFTYKNSDIFNELSKKEEKITEVKPIKATETQKKEQVAKVETVKPQPKVEEVKKAESATIKGNETGTVQPTRLPDSSNIPATVGGISSDQIDERTLHDTTPDSSKSGAGLVGDRSPVKVKSVGKVGRVEDNNKAIAILENKGYSTLQAKYTKEEIEQLRLYSGAGGKAVAGADGKGLLSEYYTPPEVTTKVWDLVKQFTNLNSKSLALEPSVGIGSLLTQKPESLTVDSYEYQKVSGTIAQILYPNIHVNIGNGFEFGNEGNFETSKEINKYDLVVGNPPFGERASFLKGKGVDPKINRWEEFFIKRGLESLKEGGTLVYVINSSFLNKSTTVAKEQISKIGELVQAIRLPEGIFADTSVGTDIVVFKKSSASGSTGQRVNKLTNNNYFTDNPQYIAGTTETRLNKFGREETFVKGTIEDVKRISTVKEVDEQPVVSTVANLTKETKPKLRKVVSESSTTRVMDKVKEQGKREALPVIITPTTEVIPTIAKQTLNSSKVSPTELRIFKNTNVDGSVEFKEDFKKYLNYDNGSYYHDVNYFSGDIYEKLEDLTRNRAKIIETLGQAQYDKQLKGLNKVKPVPVTLEQISFDPLDRFINKVTVPTENGNSTILNRFTRFVNDTNPPLAYGVYRSDVENYVNGRRASAGTKNKMGAIKAEAKRLFNYYIQNILDSSVQKNIVDTFNKEKNSYVNPDYTKVPVEVKGMSEFFRGKTFNLSPTQASGVAFLNNKGVGLVAYGVGVGKTHTLIVSTMAAHQKGWNKRPAFIVPKSTISETWIGTLQAMFPNKTIINLGGLNRPDVIKMEKLRGKDRSKWIKDGEITVITHEGLLRLALKPDELSSAIGDLKDVLTTEGKSERGKQLEGAKIEQIIGKAQYKAGDINISDLGIDHISVDEVHNFRKIFQGAKPEVLNEDGTPDKSVSKRFGNVVGGTPSKQAQQLFLISQHILKRNNNRGVYLASATPFENHATEVYNILSLMARSRMQKMGIQNINDFFALFSNFETELEKNVQGEWVNKEKMKSFRNLPQLQKLLREFVDYQTDPTLVRPDRMVMTPHLQMSSLQEENLDKIQEMLAPKGNVKPEEGAVLKASTYSVANSISPYFIKEYYPNIVTPEELIENSPKLKYAMELVKSLQAKEDVNKYGTFVYIGSNGIDYHNHITDYAVQKLGFKADEVGVINGSTSNDERERIKKEFNSGKIKFLLGGDPTKEGIDLQNNGYTTINVALGWNPTEVAQVEGRVWRQGNTRSIAPLVYPLVENSGDVTIYNKFEEKGGRINDLFSYQGNIFDVGELDPREKKLALMTRPEDKASIEIEMDKAEAQNKLIMLSTDINNLERSLKDLDNLRRDLDDHERIIADGKTRFSNYPLSYERLQEFKDMAVREKKKIKSIEAMFEKKGIIDVSSKISELKVEEKLAEEQIKKIGETYAEKLTKYQSEYTDMVANRKSIGDHVNDFFSQTKDLKVLSEKEIETKKNQLIAQVAEKKLKAPSGNADVGGYADVEIKDKQLMAIEFPELVSMVKELTGNAPSVKEFKDALGKMYSKDRGYIKLNPSIFKDQVLAQKVLAHEIGHLADYIPTNTLKRGNLLGRIASLNKFMKGNFGELNNREIKEELKKLTQIWKPFDVKASKSFTDYRYSSKELYADAVSVLLNQPQLLKEQAPKFYEGFFEYLHSKPEFEKEYFDTIELLNKGQDAVNDKRLADMYEGFAEAKAKREAIENEVKTRESWIDMFMRQNVTKFQPIYSKLGKVDIGQVESSKQKTREALEDMQMRRNDQVLFLDKVVSDITTPLEKIGLSEEDLGIVLTLERETMGDRVNLANPGGMIGKIPETVLDKFYKTKNMTPEQAKVFDQVKTRFHELVFAETERAVANGNFNKQIFEEKIKPNKDTYATFSVVHYIHKNYITPGIKSQTGTMSTIENPFTSTIMKTMSLIDWNNVQEAKQVIVGELTKHFAEDMTKAEAIRGDEGNVVKFKKIEGREVLEVMEDGKRTGYNVDPYIKAMFDNKNMTPDELHQLVLISKGFNKAFKPMVTTYNLGWLFFNPLKDLNRTYTHLGAALNKFAPDKKNFSMAELLVTFVKSIPEGTKFAAGKKDDLIKEILRNRAMSNTWSQYDPYAENDSSIAPILRQYKIIGKEPVWAVRKALDMSLGKILSAVEFLGGVYDATGKIAGYQLAKKRISDGKRLGFLTRNYVGTPNYMDGGDWKQITNEVFVFSNVAAQATRASVELATDPKTASGFWMRNFQANVIPKLLMLAVAGGLFGEALKDMLKGVSEYDKTNYFIIPMGYDENGKTVYLRVPQDQTGRFFSAMVWKAGEFARTGVVSKPEQILALGAGYLPSVTPMYTAIGDWFGYLGGRNPYDSFRGRLAIDDTSWKAGGVVRLKKMVQYSLSTVGVWNFQTYDASSQSTLEATVNNTPIINKFLKVSDYGKTEVLNEIKGDVIQKQAQETLRKRDLVSKAVDSYKDGTQSITRKMEVERQLVKDLLGEPPYDTGDKIKRANTIKQFRISLMRGKVDNDVDSLISATTNDEKLQIMEIMQKARGDDEMKGIINDLRKEKIISDELISKYKRQKSKK